MKSNRAAMWLVILCVCTGAAATVRAQWQFMGGPSGGCVSSILELHGTLFVTTRGAGVFQSTDLGGQWTPVAPDSLSRWSSVITASGNELFVADGSGVARSTDAGATWNLMRPGMNSITAMIAVGGTLYGYSYYSGVVRSGDFGAHWILVNIGMDSAATSFARIGNDLFATDGTVRKWNPDLQEWHPSNTGLSGGRFLALCASNDTLYAGGASGVFASFDNGREWTRINGPATLITHIAANGAIIIAASDSDIFKTTDGGATWLHAGLHNDRVTSVLSTDSFAFVCTTRSGVLRAGRNSAWYKSSEGISNVALTGMTIAGDRIYLATSIDDPLFASDDHGSTWTPAESGLPDTTVAITLAVDSFLFACPASGGLYRSAGGHGWASIAFSGQRVRTLAAGHGRLFAVVDRDRGRSMYRSTDLGATWVSINNGAPDNKFIVTDRYLYAYSSPYLFRSANNGNTWMKVDTLTPGKLLPYGNVFAAGGDTLYLVANQQRALYRTTDAGNSWTMADTGLVVIPDTIIAAGPALIARAYGHGVWVKLNANAPFTSMSGGLRDSSLLAIGVTNDDLYAITGNAIWRRPLGELLTPVKETGFIALPPVATLEQNYPNPFVDATTLRFTLRMAAHVSLDVFDVNGRRISTLISAIQPAGFHEALLRSTGLHSGVYTVRLLVDGELQSRSMEVVK